MDSWIMWIVGISVAYWIGHTIGKHIGTINVLQVLSNDPKRIQEVVDKLKTIEEESVEALPLDAIEMEIQKVNGMIYAYDKQTGEFLAQGDSIEAAVMIASKRYPGKSFGVLN